MNPLLIIILVLWAVSGVGLVIFVLLHSGKGTGLSDVIAGQMYNSPGGSGIVEKNLNRITITLAVIFFLTLLVLMIIYPQGTIS
ncbi:MAG: preprotein translocase subunit SecG [Coriobacteriia bacterium]|nr:preprotein translocase subunit SecG [Coriobacteriia bacterium]